MITSTLTWGLVWLRNQNMLDKYLYYIKNNKGSTKKFKEIIEDFSNDKEKAEKFLEWCLKRNLCFQKGLDEYEINP